MASVDRSWKVQNKTQKQKQVCKGSTQVKDSTSNQCKNNFIFNGIIIDQLINWKKFKGNIAT